MPRRRSSFTAWMTQGRKIVAGLTERKHELEAELERIGTQLAGVTNMIAAPTERAPRRGRRRGRTARRVPGRRMVGRRRGGLTLPTMVRDLLDKAGAPMTIKQVETAVLQGGYRTAAKTIYNAVYTTLKKLGAKRVGRGTYVLRGSAGRG